jgi:hypothetical protein
MKCTVCEGRAFCLCERLTGRKQVWETERDKNLAAAAEFRAGQRPIDRALEDTQRLMDETRIRKEALRMAEALVKLLGDGK